MHFPPPTSPASLTHALARSTLAHDGRRILGPLGLRVGAEAAGKRQPGHDLEAGTAEPAGCRQPERGTVLLRRPPGRPPAAGGSASRRLLWTAHRREAVAGWLMSAP